MTPAKTHQGERLGVSPPCRLHRRTVKRSPQLAANRRSAGLCVELNSTSGFRDSQRWTRRADAQPLAESTTASGGRQPSGTLRFRPRQQFESQRTGKLTHAARQGTRTEEITP